MAVVVVVVVVIIVVIVVILIIIIQTQSIGVRMTQIYLTVGKLKDSTKLQINSKNFFQVNF
jgi:hypothetical protein